MRNKKHFAIFVAIALIVVAAVVVSVNNTPPAACDNCTVTYNDTVITTTRNATAVVDATKVVVNKTLLNKQNTRIVYFYQDDCPYCVQMEPVINKLVSEGYQIRLINLTSDPNGKALVAQYGVVSTPSLFMTNTATGKALPLIGVYTYGQVIEDIIQIGG